MQLLKSEEDDGCRYYLLQDAEHDYQQENMVFRYVNACREFSLVHNNFIISTDAHDGCGKKLQNTLVSTIGKLWLSPPQAHIVATVVE